MPLRRSFLASTALILGVIAAAGAGWHVYHDNRGRFPQFDARDSTRWQAYGGDWMLRDGVYTNRANGRGDKLVGGPRNEGDYTVSAGLRFDTAPEDPQFGDAGLLLRVLDPGEGVDQHRGYYAALRPDDHMLLIGGMAFSFRELATTPFPHEIRSGHWYRLTFTAHGCTFRVHAEDTETKEAADVSYVERECTPRQGQVGLRSYYAKASWRDLQVVPLKP